MDMDFDFDTEFDAKLDSLLEKLDKEFNTSRKKHIVAVDDDRNVLKLIKTILGETYDITPMANGMMAINYFKNKTADLILLDYEMPVMSGADTLKKLREMPNTANIPVVFLTSVSDNEKVKEIMMLGVTDYILKPINVDRIRSDIKRILG
ncbi:MAG: two-component system response regulator [Oscillospiraceae bacterium]